MHTHKKGLAKHIVLYESVGFGLIFMFLWLNEVLDLPHRLFGTTATPINWAESAIESVLIAILAVLVAFYTRRFLAQIKHLEGYLVVCAACRRVRVGSDWVPFDVFLRDHSDAAVSHGLCPQCGVQFMREKDAG